MLADHYVLYFRKQGVQYLPPELFHDIDYRKQGLMVQLLGMFERLLARTERCRGAKSRCCLSENRTIND